MVIFHCYVSSPEGSYIHPLPLHLALPSRVGKKSNGILRPGKSGICLEDHRSGLQLTVTYIDIYVAKLYINIQLTVTG